MLGTCIWACQVMRGARAHLSATYNFAAWADRRLTMHDDNLTPASATERRRRWGRALRRLTSVFFPPAVETSPSARVP